MKKVIIKTVPYSSDNYSYLIHCIETGTTALVDCGDAEPVYKQLKQEGWTLHQVLLTHHHYDHAAGVRDMKLYYPELELFKPAGESRISQQSTEVNDGDLIQCGKLEIRAISLPFHTKHCTTYHVENNLFVGDTLFSAGCGRMFEGSAEDLEQTMKKISDFPDDTKVFVGHEYTMSNLQFAKAIEPKNQEIQNYIAQVQEKRKKREPTSPTTIGLEKQVNPFLRVDQKDLINQIDPTNKMSRTERLKRLREQKDQF